MDDPGWDFQCPGPEDDICMRSCTKSSNRGVGYQKKKKGHQGGTHRTRKGRLLRVRRRLRYRHCIVFHRSVFRPSRDQLGSKVFHRKPPLNIEIRRVNELNCVYEPDDLCQSSGCSCRPPGIHEQSP